MILLQNLNFLIERYDGCAIKNMIEFLKKNKRIVKFVKLWRTRFIRYEVRADDVKNGYAYKY